MQAIIIGHAISTVVKVYTVIEIGIEQFYWKGLNFHSV